MQMNIVAYADGTALFIKARAVKKAKARPVLGRVDCCALSITHVRAFGSGPCVDD